MTATHRQLPVKVNAFVDAGVAPLVAALNAFDGLWTIDSCQRSEEGAYVYFNRAGGGKRLATFVHDLSTALGARLDSTEYDFRVEWLAGTDTPIAKLTTHPASIDSIAIALRAVASESRRNESTGDNEDRAPHS